MKTSTKTKTARIVIGELPSAGTSGPLNLNSAAVATVHGGAVPPRPINYSDYLSQPDQHRLLREQAMIEFHYYKRVTFWSGW
jgi:hypothetical protein